MSEDKRLEEMAQDAAHCGHHRVAVLQEARRSHEREGAGQSLTSRECGMKERTRAQLMPKKAVLIHESTKDAWWYINDRSIDVFVQHNSGSVAACRVYLRDIDRKRVSK
jgi:hypothetical protein